jgi:hypothetical protein
MEKGRLTNNSTPEYFCKRDNYWVADCEAINTKDSEIPGLLSRRIIDGRQHLLMVDQGEPLPPFIKILGLNF